MYLKICVFLFAGGGFAGSKIARELELKFDVTLLDEKDTFEFIPSFPIMAVQPSHGLKISSKHTNYLMTSQILVCEGGVKEVREKEVVLGDGRTVAFDYLCISTGSKYDLVGKVAVKERRRSSSVTTREGGTSSSVDRIVDASNAKALLAANKRLVSWCSESTTVNDKAG